MLMPSVPLSGALNYLTALSAPSNVRSVTMPRGNNGPVAVTLPLTAECKMVQLHEKSLLDIRSRQGLTTSVVSVYTTRPFALTGVSSDEAKGKKRSSSLQQRRSEPRTMPLLFRRTNSASENDRPNASPVRRSKPIPYSSTAASHGVDLRRNISSNVLIGNGGDKKMHRVPLSQKQPQLTKKAGPVMPSSLTTTSAAEHPNQFDYVPSLIDIKTQRHINQRLESVRRLDQKKAEHRRDEEKKQERVTFKEKMANQKKRQRQEIYALNKVMTDMEYKQFQELVQTQGLNE